MSWHILIFIQTLCAALAIIVSRSLAREKKYANSGLAITAGWFVVLYAFGLTILPLLGDFSFASLQTYWWRFLLGGVAFALTNIFAFSMLVHLDAATASIFNTSAVWFTVFGAALLLHEDLNSLQYLATVILLFAIIYTALATKTKRTKIARKNLMLGLLYANLSALFIAIASINEKSLLNHVTIGDYVAFGWAAQTLAAILAVLLLNPRSLTVLKEGKVLTWTVVLGILRVGAGLMFVLSSIKSNNVAIVSVISNFRLILVFILGIWLLNERRNIRQKIIGSTFAVLAVTLMFW